jgi:hypothetical protein
MPTNRVSSSALARADRHERADGGAVAGGLGLPVVAGWSGDRTSVMQCAPPERHGRAATRGDG